MEINENSEGEVDLYISPVAEHLLGRSAKQLSVFVFLEVLTSNRKPFHKCAHISDVGKQMCDK